MTRALTGFLVGAPVWLAIGVYIGLRLVWAEEPEPITEPTEWWAAQLLDEARPRCNDTNVCGFHVAQVAAGYLSKPQTDDWATDPYPAGLVQ